MSTASSPATFTDPAKAAGPRHLRFGEPARIERGPNGEPVRRATPAEVDALARMVPAGTRWPRKRKAGRVQK